MSEEQNKINEENIKTLFNMYRSHESTLYFIRNELVKLQEKIALLEQKSHKHADEWGLDS